MIEDQPSRTALAVAVLRAVHQVADTPRVFTDPLALAILGPDGPAIVQAQLADASRSLRLRASVAGRSRLAEDALADATSRDVQQYVLLGAGLDSFGCRGALPEVAVFEVDHPATQAWKRRMLDAAGLTPPPRLHFVSMDFERQDLRATLAEAGFRFDAPALFAMLGVAIYVERAALQSTWALVAAMPAGTAELVFDYAADFSAAPEPTRAAYQAMADRAAAAGEPWRTYFEPAALETDLLHAGFASVQDLDAAAITRKLFAGRTDGLAPGPFAHFVRAWN